MAECHSAPATAARPEAQWPALENSQIFAQSRAQLPPPLVALPLAIRLEGDEPNSQWMSGPRPSGTAGHVCAPFDVEASDGEATAMAAVRN